MSKSDVKLYYMIGLPGSGKSTYAKEIAEKFEGEIHIHSSDSLREELFGDVNENSRDSNEKLFRVLHRRIKDDLQKGVSVVYDATNVNKKNRLEFLRFIEDVDCEKLCVLVMLPYHMCLTRNMNRERVVPPNVIERMYRRFQPPSKKEGWDGFFIYVNCDSSEIEAYSVNTLFNNASGIDYFNQENSHHKDTLGMHSRKVADLMHEYKPELEYTALIHDVGKLFTKSRKNAKGEDDGDCHYYNHNCVGAYESIFYLLNDTDLEDAEKIIYNANLIYYHMVPYNKDWNDTESKVRRLKSQLGEELYEDIVLLHRCDKESHED